MTTNTDTTIKPTSKKTLARYLPTAALAIWTIANQVQNFYLPMNRDSGLFAYGGWRILHGALPYIDFFDNKLPGVYYINALAVALFGPTRPGIVMFGMLYAILTGLAFHALARRFCSKYIALVATALFIFYQGNYGLCEDGNYCECYTALPMILAALTLVRWSEKRTGMLGPVIAGVLGAIAVLIKQPSVSIVIASALFALCSGKRIQLKPVLGVVLGVLAVAVPIVIWMAAKGMLGEAIQDNLVFNRLYLADAYSDGRDAARRLLPVGLNVTALPLVGAIAAIVCRSIRKTPVAAGAWLLIPWFVIDLAGIAMGGRFYNHYFLALIPSAMLLTAIFVNSLKPKGWRRVAWAAAALALFAGPVWRIEGDGPPTYTGLGGSALQRQTVAWQWIANRRIDEGYTLPFEDAAAYISQHTSQRDTIYTWGWCTRIAFLSQREICSRYLHMHPLGATGFDRDRRIRELARDIATRKPKYIIDESLLMPTTAPPLGAGPTIPSTSPFFRLDGYEPVKRVVARDYTQVDIVANHIIYERR